MKKKLKTIFTVLAFVVCLTFMNLPVNAASMLPKYDTIYSNTVILEDGSYIADELQVLSPNDNSVTPAASTYTKSATRTYTYYNTANKKCWTFHLKGTFQYNGSTAKATSSSTSYSIFVNGWKCNSRNSSCSGNTVKGTANFKMLLNNINVTIGLRCSASGTISNVNY